MPHFLRRLFAPASSDPDTDAVRAFARRYERTIRDLLRQYQSSLAETGRYPRLYYRFDDHTGGRSPLSVCHWLLLFQVPGGIGRGAIERAAIAVESRTGVEGGVVTVEGDTFPAVLVPMADFTTEWLDRQLRELVRSVRSS